MSVSRPLGLPNCGGVKGGDSVHVPDVAVTGPMFVGLKVAVNVPSVLKFTTNSLLLMIPTCHGPCRTFRIASKFVPAVCDPAGRPASAAAPMLHRRPAPVAPVPLVSSPIHRLPLGSRANKFVFAESNEKFDAFAPFLSTPP